MIRARILITMKPADVAWLAILAIVLGVDLSCRDATLSKAYDRYLARHPWLARLVVVATALHLINALPVWCDPWEWVWQADAWWRKLLLTMLCRHEGQCCRSDGSCGNNGCNHGCK